MYNHNVHTILRYVEALSNVGRRRAARRQALEALAHFPELEPRVENFMGPGCSAERERGGDVASQHTTNSRDAAATENDTADATVTDAIDTERVQRARCLRGLVGSVAARHRAIDSSGDEEEDEEDEDEEEVEVDEGTREGRVGYWTPPRRPGVRGRVGRMGESSAGESDMSVSVLYSRV